MSDPGPGRPSGPKIPSLRIALKFPIDCDPDSAWRALHSPRTIAELYGPLLQLTPTVSLPSSWISETETTVNLRLAGRIPLGRQLIAVTDTERAHQGQRVRILHDNGIPLAGALAALSLWDHRMAVSELPGTDGRTLWRERLLIGGHAAPALWPVLWATWQWRANRIRALAPGWAHQK